MTFPNFIFKLLLITVFWKKTQMGFFPASKCYVLQILAMQVTRADKIKTEINLYYLLSFWFINLFETTNF